jgi:AAA domain, putative AbiEii toxin, Type IV TA system
MNRGSEWLRWEPHIHAPGTILNDQFAANDWDAYIAKLVSASPAIEVIGVTDYYVTDAYQRLSAAKDAGQLPGVKFIFPNVEVRLTAPTKTGYVNAHLMVCPDDSDHLKQLDRILTHLTFEADGEVFCATRDDLIRFGKKAKAGQDDRAALAYAATQFKVDFYKLREHLRTSDWAAANIRIAVAGGADGTSGMNQASDATIRAEIEKFAHIIFASSPAQRDFWLGRKSLQAAEVRRRYGGLKPCMHGSDAHSLDKVGEAAERYTWIKGGATFDALRQACIDPENRAFVGSTAPRVTAPSTVISQVEVRNAPWFGSSPIPLNSGLVAVIGARGSGKTALLDVIAHGCDSSEEFDETRSSSFLSRARTLLGDATVRLEWASGRLAEKRLAEESYDDFSRYPRARYLSQKFVEELCSSTSMSDGLFAELERVVFEAHESDSRASADSFQELLEMRAARYRLAREREEGAVTESSNQISIELEKEKLIPQYEAQIGQKTQQIDAYEKDRAKLVTKGSETLVDWHTKVTNRFAQLNGLVRSYNKQRQTYDAMRDEVADQRTNKAPQALRQMQIRHSSSDISPEKWSAFLLDYCGNVDEDLTAYQIWADGKIKELVGEPTAEKPVDQAYITGESLLEAATLSVVTQEKERLEKLINADAETQRQYALLTTRITAENSALQTTAQKLIDAKGAHKRAAELTTAREGAYKRVFDAIVSEQLVLESLYQPLKSRLGKSEGTLGRLSFSVRRVADVQKWAQEGQDLYVDRRKQGPFRVKGSLIDYANETLRPAWESGTAQDVGVAMTAFRDQHQDELLKEAPMPKSDHTDYRNWSKRFAKWLFSTEHIRIEYNIQYLGVDIRKLSPGTRGIVLLLLYLALDDEDDRPLIIDQPEENLDPKSVYDELVPLFIEAKGRRQVIIVTHNANLVVNTDADQIIVADAISHAPGNLPTITYVSGGLDESPIREMVCNILEGGEEAFRERARRLRVEWRSGR